MDKVLEKLIDQLPSWPKAAQDQALKTLLAIEAERVGPYRLSESEQKAIAEGREQARLGLFVSEEEVATFYKRHGL